MTVGSVRGKLTFEMPVRLAHDGRVRGVGVAVEVPVVEPFGSEARSVGGQARLKPALTESVGWPHCAQNGLRAFQSRICRARA